MWKVSIKQEYEYSYMDGAKSTGTNESTFEFEHYADAAVFVKRAIETGATTTYAQIEFVEGEAK